VAAAVGPQPLRHWRDTARFLPGTIVAGRYRMVGLLGRGGMGEVYRADDLKLGQSVALKFLPEALERDPARLERFLNEVRLSLRVTHPNVCRAFDVGQIDGPATGAEGAGVRRQFISMEYVDGEDLASLLRRIGRLPEDKAVEIARQLCAGLAAAHDEGVLHRDLKPANIMIDGRGRAKITDFGLASATGISGPEAQVGTPQYMAPEQVAGRELTERTDIYALGLVLYELFTGKRAFDAKNVHDLAQLQSSTPASPSALVSGLNPLIERAILRCVDPDPAKRPSSAASLASALPGGDPLAMAMAAGETPSPEMVARAGGEGALRPGVAVACLVLFLAGLGGIWLAEHHSHLENRVAMPKPAVELAIAARAVLAAAGYTHPPADSAFGFDRDPSYFDKVTKDDRSPQRWDNLRSVEPSPVWFWYRESPAPLEPIARVGTATALNPPLTRAGMTYVRLDPRGHLMRLRAVPPDLSEVPGPWTEPDWTRLLSAAGFDPESLVLSEPLWPALEATDVRRAWMTKDRLRIEAGAFRGRPVWFSVIPSWRPASTSAASEPPLVERIAQHVLVLFPFAVALGSVFLARRNIRLGRGDRRGALHYAAVVVGVGAAATLLENSDAPANRFALVGNTNLALTIYEGAFVWLFYLAIEPYVRRLWPKTLIAWSRVLEGRLRDPLVGQHVLLGAIAGVAVSLLIHLELRVTGLPGAPSWQSIAALATVRADVAAHVDLLRDALRLPIFILMAVLVLRVVLRRTWVAYCVFVGLPVVSFASGASLPDTIVFATLLALSLIVLTRLGLLALLVLVLFSDWPNIPLTTDPSSWFFPSSVVTMLMFATVGVYGFVVSLGGQRLFKDQLLDA
jgi:serine/threonine-protein kinase